MVNSKKLKNYFLLMRLDKPVGIFLLLWPTLIALWFASRGVPTLKILIVFILGVIVMRSAGCVANDLADQRFDAFVMRTRGRPLIIGSVTRREAKILLLFLLLIAFWLVLGLNILSLKLSVVALLLALIYPLTKRFFNGPQIFLGAAYGFAVPMAYAAVLSEIPLMAWWLFLAALIWAVSYDTLYAMVDREDDERIGLKSTAIWFGRYDKLVVFIGHLCVLVIMFGLGISQKLNGIYYIGISVALLLAIYQQVLIRTQKTEACFKAFLNNQWFGLALFSGVLFSYCPFNGS